MISYIAKQGENQTVAWENYHNIPLQAVNVIKRQARPIAPNLARNGIPNPQVKPSLKDTSEKEHRCEENNVLHVELCGLTAAFWPFRCSSRPGTVYCI